MPNQLYTGTKMVTDVFICDLENSNRAIVLPNPSEVTFDQGIEMEETMGVTPLGEMQLVDLYPRQRNPRIQMTFPKKTPETLGMKFGYRMEADTGIAAAIRRNGVQIDRNSYPAAATGKEGFGILADAEGAFASYLDENNISVPLTQGTFATFDNADELTFAVGLNGALKFTDDLIGKYVSYEIPYTLTDGVIMTENLFNRFKPTLVVIQNDLKIVSFEFPEAIVDPSDGEINFNESQLQITMRITYNGTGCLPVKVKHLGQARQCADAA
ncbi:hypothetical protein ACX27_04310 [Nostoc piscinale CENA21]|uniref:Uncharacterized protein n=1 Tax=Nostoc piscinale CENA21 TaxID=224013 RepID=A0A0M4SP63_9NOSO|nr:hypothetical protein [Nostoc piscinale]ALF52252.1 hypothetical protein ACX27_04310 [Nostoc piscinale CENA21]